MILGACHVENPFIAFGQISTVFYFGYFILLGGISLIENSLMILNKGRALKRERGRCINYASQIIHPIIIHNYTTNRLISTTSSLYYPDNPSENGDESSSEEERAPESELASDVSQDSGIGGESRSEEERAPESELASDVSEDSGIGDTNRRDPIGDLVRAIDRREGGTGDLR